MVEKDGLDGAPGGSGKAFRQGFDGGRKRLWTVFGEDRVGRGGIQQAQIAETADIGPSQIPRLPTTRERKQQPRVPISGTARLLIVESEFSRHLQVNGECGTIRKTPQQQLSATFEGDDTLPF